MRFFDVIPKQDRYTADDPMRVPIRAPQGGSDTLECQIIVRTGEPARKPRADPKFAAHCHALLSKDVIGIWCAVYRNLVLRTIRECLSCMQNIRLFIYVV